MPSAARGQGAVHLHGGPPALSLSDMHSGGGLHVPRNLGAVFTPPKPCTDPSLALTAPLPGPPPYRCQGPEAPAHSLTSGLLRGTSTVRM